MSEKGLFEIPWLLEALTVGSIVTGIPEIYGTTNPLTIVYWILGGIAALLLLLALIGEYGPCRCIRWS